jgi:hypothetical protein
MGRLGGLYDFSAILFHGICSPEDYFHFAPLGVNCLQSWPGGFGGISGLFCWV